MTDKLQNYQVINKELVLRNKQLAKANCLLRNKVANLNSELHSQIILNSELRHNQLDVKSKPVRTQDPVAVERIRPEGNFPS